MYADIIAPKSPEEAERMVERAETLGYSVLGILGNIDVKRSHIRTFRAVLTDKIEPKLRKELKRESDLILVKPGSLEEARKLTFSSLVDGAVATYDSERPRIDYVCMRQLKRNEGALIIPLAHLVKAIESGSLSLRSVEIELKLARRGGVYPVICSFASSLEEQVPPRMMMSFAEFFFDLAREEARRMVKDFPVYMISKERKLKLRGRVPFEVQGTD